MKTDKLTKLFEDLDFDLAEPSAGHRDRFQEKLEQSAKKENSSQSKIRSLLGPFLGIAASIALAIFLFGNIHMNNATGKKGDLASVSTEMKETQDFYTSVIQKELKNIEAEKTPETEAMINDAFSQMKKLETEYSKLKKDLINSGQDKRVIYAMINNFQQRIDLLNNVLTQIENIKSLKTKSHESTII
ncbi:MAG TPA: DUF4179 domain-containing protein [Salegentibacter sp.]|uniref:DUF4179 domain-containing protein n=1 Tax=Salegentibacter sp. TaxID=1903072 RepID=UPI002F94ABC4